MEFEEVMDHIEKADVDSKGYITEDELRNYFLSLNQNPDFIDVSNSFSQFYLDSFHTDSLDEMHKSFILGFHLPTLPYS